MSAPVQPRPILRRAVTIAGVLSGLLLAACSAESSGSASPAGSASAASSSTGTAPPTSSDAPSPGSASGDVANIRAFGDPAAEIKTAEDLADYLLPGMTGAGVDCATGKWDPESALSLAFVDGAEIVADVVVSCVEQPGIGALVAMYAVGFTEGGAEQYADVADCAADALDAASGQTVRGYLQEIYTARLDLAGPATSPDIAAGIIRELGCGAQPSVESPTSETQSPATSTSTLPEADPGERTVHWTSLQTGDCMVTMPADDENDVLLDDCATPHAAEVIGRTLTITGTEEATCLDIFESYVGEDFETATSLDMTRYTSTDSFQDPVLICLVHAADDSLLTGSVKAG